MKTAMSMNGLGKLDITTEYIVQIAEKTVCVHCNPDYMELDDCTGPEPKTVTNGDRIRTMSDEELDEAFRGGGLCSYIQAHDPKFCEERGACTNCVIEWLKRPAEES